MLIFVLAFAGLGYLIYTPSVLQDKREVAVYTPPKLETQPHYVIGTLRICSDPWSPYAADANDAQEGYVVEIIRKIYEPLGYDVEYINAPWSRCIRDTREGVFHALAGADIDEVPDFIFPTQSVGVTHPEFFTREDFQWTFEGTHSLENIRLGAIKDYTYSSALDVYIRRHLSDSRMTILTGKNALENLVNLLLAGRIDVFVENAPAAQFMFNKMGIEPGKIKADGSPGAGVVLYVPFSPKYDESRELVSIFDRGITQLRKSGSLFEILSRYKIDDWEKEADLMKKAELELED